VKKEGGVPRTGEDRTPYEAMRRRLQRRTLIVATSFLVALWIMAQATSMRGVLGTQPPNLRLLLLLRTVFILFIFGALILAFQYRLRLATRVVLSTQLVSLVTFAMISAEPGFVGFLGTIAAAILSVQLATLLISSFRGRLIFGGAVSVVVFVVAVWFVRIGPPGQRQLLIETIVTAVFMFAIVFVPSLAGAFERTHLTNILTQIAYIDSTTGLPNAARLTDELDDVHQREGTFAVFAITILGIGKVNRKYGYVLGDRVMHQVANRLRQMREKYSVYRIPGATFVCVPTVDWKPDQNPRVLNDLRTAVVQPVRTQDLTIDLSCRIFGTVAPTDGRSAGRLIHNLQNMTAQTNEHRDSSRIEWFDPFQYHRLERQYTIEESVKNAVLTNAFVAYVQPKTSIHNGTLHGGEVLARWNHPEYGAVSPGEFIPAVEGEGLMVPFTKQILASAEESLQTLPESIREGIVIAVNLTASSLASQGTVGIIKEAVRRFAPTKIEIELTEDVFLMMDDSVAGTLSEIKALGVQLALDDFGTGFSNFSYLQEIHVDTIKIDRRFVLPLPEDTHSYEIVRAICAMARSFGIETVAEGVETEAQLDVLKGAGCDVAQGYFFSRPLPGEEFVAYCTHAMK
jgi:predicted signal transduction protein with EAL and GGDEF domain